MLRGRHHKKQLAGDADLGGQFQETTVFGQNAQIFVYAAGSRAVLTVVSDVCSAGEPQGSNRECTFTLAPFGAPSKT